MQTPPPGKALLVLLCRVFLMPAEQHGLAAARHSSCCCVLAPSPQQRSATSTEAFHQSEELWLLCVLQLLNVERMNLYVSSIRVCFLLFESMRIHLKFQLEVNPPCFLLRC